jgi:hypothetical protein
MGKRGRAGTRPGGAGRRASAVTVAAQQCRALSTTTVRGSARGAGCARGSVRGGAGPHHSPRERRGCRRGKGAGGWMGVSPFSLGEESNLVGTSMLFRKSSCLQIQPTLTDGVQQSFFFEKWGLDTLKGTLPHSGLRSFFKNSPSKR